MEQVTQAEVALIGLAVLAVIMIGGYELFEHREGVKEAIRAVEATEKIGETIIEPIETDVVVISDIVLDGTSKAKQDYVTIEGGPYALKWLQLLGSDIYNDGFGSFRGQPEGQTQGQQELYTPYLVKNGVWAGSWGANQNSPIISNADLLRISTQQKPDAVYTLNQKMQHITNAGRGTWGQAIKATYTPSDNWRAAVDIRINQAVYANNRVEILERKVMTVDTFGTVTILRIRTGWDQIHKYTAVTSANAHYENVKGGIYLPLLPKAGYEWWILERWTKPL